MSAAWSCTVTYDRVILLQLAHQSFRLHHGYCQSCGDLRESFRVRTFGHEGALTRHAHRAYTVKWCSMGLDLSPQTPIVSLASTQSSLLAHEVYLTDRLDNRTRDRLPHMRCVCFLRPVEASLAALESELRTPKYGSYYLCQSVNRTFYL
jgi:hypothetical protein